MRAMPGRAIAVSNGTSLRNAVVTLAEGLGLKTDVEVDVGRRLWGARRKIDVVVTDPATRRRLGVECKYQGAQGTAEEKIPATVEDIRSWPIDGIVVFAGAGFSLNMKGFLLSTGKAVELSDLEVWLRLYFGLELR
jgi:hypothetical protein